MKKTNNFEMTAAMVEPTGLGMTQSDATAQLVEAMRGIASIVSGMSERMTLLEKELRMLTKVTGAQAAELNRAVRDKAVAICEARSLGAAGEKAIANAIRRAIKLTAGIDAIRDLPRCEYGVTLRRVQLWEDFKEIKKVKSRMEAKA